MAVVSMLKCMVVIVAAALLGQTDATHSQARLRRTGSKWWFWTSKAEAAKPKVQPPPKKRLADTKNALISTAVFQRKAEADCAAATLMRRQHVSKRLPSVSSAQCL